MSLANHDKKFEKNIITHQIWKGEKMPNIFNEYRKEWLDMFPDYNHMFHKDDDLRDLIKNYYFDYLEIYDSFQYDIERIDFFRCAMLHHYGGIYIDLDVLPLKSLDSFLSENKVILGFEPDEHLTHWKINRGNKIIGNALMISPKGNVFWLNLMDYIKKNYVWGKGPVYNTGPICISKFYKEHPDYFKNVIITDSNCFYPITNGSTNKTQTYKGKEYNHVAHGCDIEKAYVVHLWSGSWGKETSSNLDDYVVFLIGYCFVAVIILFIIFILAISKGYTI
jgi:mannosyltransferase OCH1-like enzyme